MGEAGQLRRKRPSRRFVLQAVAVAVVVALVLWWADALARVGAETLLEQNIQNATGVELRPEVEVQGVLFLPQVIRGAYSEVHVTTWGMTSGPLRIDRVESQLFDVRVPFHDVLVRDIRQVGIGRSVENIHLTYPDLNAYFSATGRPLSLAPGRNGLVTISGTVDVLARKVRATADVALSVQDDVMRISPRSVDTGSASLEEASRLLLGQRLTLTVPLGALPFGHRLTGVEADPNGVHITAEGIGILLEP